MTGLPHSRARTGSKGRSLDSTAAAVRSLPVGRYTGVLLGLGVMVVYLSITQPVFLTWPNWENIFRSEGDVFVLGIGMTFVVLGGGIDLSVASSTVAAGMVLGLIIEHGGDWWLACLACVATGTVLGLVNGMLIAKLRIPFFVVTLGTLSIYQSIALVMTSGSTISLFAYPTFGEVDTLINGSTGVFPTVLLIGAGLYALAGFVLHFTRYGRSVYAVGSNVEAARLTGIKVSAVTTSIYGVAGLCAGLAGVVDDGRLTAAGPQVDPNLMLTVIAAVLIGGTSFAGGDGGLIGTVLGVLFLGVVQNGLELLNVSTFWQGTVSGAILIIAVGLGVLREHGWRSWLRTARRRQLAGPDEE